MVLDDRTARAYDREGGLDLIAGDGMVGGNDKKPMDDMDALFGGDGLIDDQSAL